MKIIAQINKNNYWIFILAIAQIKDSFIIPFLNLNITKNKFMAHNFFTYSWWLDVTHIITVCILFIILKNYNKLKTYIAQLTNVQKTTMYKDRATIYGLIYRIDNKPHNYTKNAEILFIKTSLLADFPTITATEIETIITQLYNSKIN